MTASLEGEMPGCWDASMSALRGEGVQVGGRGDAGGVLDPFLDVDVFGEGGGSHQPPSRRSLRTGSSEGR